MKKLSIFTAFVDYLYRLYSPNISLKCLTYEYTKFGDICDKYGLLQKEIHGYNSNGYVWKSSVGRILNSLIKRGLVEYEYIGKYKKVKEYE